MKKYFYFFGFILCIVGILFVWITSVTWLTEFKASRAEKVGSVYIQKVYEDYEIAGSVCQGNDTDGDKYVSCTFRIKKGDIEKEINLKCPTYIDSFLGVECKSAQTILSQ